MDILERADIEEEDETDRALMRAMQVCQSKDIPLAENFRIVYRKKGQELLKDFQLSDLACSLLMMNDNTSNEYVARTRIELNRHFHVRYLNYCISYVERL